MALLAAAGHEGKHCSLLKQESPELPGWISRLLASLVPISSWEVWASPCQGSPAGHCACPSSCPARCTRPRGAACGRSSWQEGWPRVKSYWCWAIRPMPKVLLSPIFFFSEKTSSGTFKGNLRTVLCFHKLSPLLLQRYEKRVEPFLLLTYEYLVAYR